MTAEPGASNNRLDWLPPNGPINQGPPRWRLAHTRYGYRSPTPSVSTGLPNPETPARQIVKGGQFRLRLKFHPSWRKLGPTSFLPLSKPLFCPSCTPTPKNNIPEAVERRPPPHAGSLRPRDSVGRDPQPGRRPGRRRARRRVPAPIDAGGGLWGGPDRRGDAAGPDPARRAALWLARRHAGCFPPLPGQGYGAQAVRRPGRVQAQHLPLAPDRRPGLAAADRGLSEADRRRARLFARGHSRGGGTGRRAGHHGAAGDRHARP